MKSGGRNRRNYANITMAAHLFVSNPSNRGNPSDMDEDVVKRLDERSQTPLTGAILPTNGQKKQNGVFIIVSNPSNRGNPSDRC